MVAILAVACQWRSLVAFLLALPSLLSAVPAPTFNRQVLFDQYTINVQIDDGAPPSLAYGRLKLAVDDGRGGLRLIDDLTAVSVADPTGQPLPWDEAQFVLARALKPLGAAYPVLPGGTSTLRPLKTDSGHRFFLPKAFDKTTRLEALGVAKVRALRALLFKNAILRALALEDAQRFDPALASSLAAAKAHSVVLLGLADTGAAWVEYSHEQLRIIASSTKAFQHAGPSVSAQATARQAAAAKVSERISKSRLAKAGHALAVLAYGVELAVEFDESLTRQRFLAEVGHDVLLLETLANARQLLAAGGGADPALLDGLDAALEKLTALSQSRLRQYAAAGAQAFVRTLPTLGVAIASYVGTGGVALVAREVTALAGEFHAFDQGVLSLSALATLGHSLHAALDESVRGGHGGTELSGLPVRELMGLHQRLGAEASALMYNMLWKDRWGNVTSLAGLGKGIGLTIAEWKASLKGWSVEEEYRSEVSKRIAAVHQSAALAPAMPALLAGLRRVYLEPASLGGGEGVEQIEAARQAQAEAERQAAEAVAGRRKAGTGKTFSLPGGAEMEFVWIEPGMFQMGSPESERSGSSWAENEGPVHEVEISRGFWLGKYEVTQGEWEAVMGTRPWSGKSHVRSNPSHPAVYISWDDVQGFIDKLNDAAGEVVYRLPSEAEWEYACRAGTSTRWSFGDDENQLTHYAWYEDNAWDAGKEYAQPVGTKRPNPWGLYDMHGNVWEWVQDRADDDYYNRSPRVDPLGPTSGFHRVFRGGDFHFFAQALRSAGRGGYSPSGRDGSVGVRLLRIR